MNHQQPPTGPAASFGSKLRDLRRRRGLSLTGLAVAVGCHSRTISKWQADETRPRFDALRRLSQALQCSPEALMDAN